jgi:hypothetical protein
MPVETLDGSLIGIGGKVLHFSSRRFVRDICFDGACFVCGSIRGSVPFNDEHVVPDWLLRRHKLHQQKITLPNLTSYKYGSYKVPCCVSCNSLLGRAVEERVSELLNGDYSDVKSRLSFETLTLLFSWMALLYVKTHLKDGRLSHSRRSAEKVKIGDFYDWVHLHHAHAIARLAYTNTALSHKALGSLLVLPAQQAPHFQDFDYGDLYEHQTVLVRTGGVCIIAVLNDSCGALNLASGWLERVKGELTPIQLREIMAQIAYCNASLDQRPTFSTTTTRYGECEIVASVPKRPTVCEPGEGVRGSLLEYCLDHLLRGVANEEWVRARIREARYSFVFNEDGSFNENSMQPAPTPAATEVG